MTCLNWPLRACLFFIQNSACALIAWAITELALRIPSCNSPPILTIPIIDFDYTIYESDVVLARATRLAWADFGPQMANVSLCELKSEQL